MLDISQSDKLEFKKLATTTLEADEQIDAADNIFFIKSLIQTLSLQVITWSAVRWAISHKNIDSLEFFLSIFDKDSDSWFLYHSENTSHNLINETTDKFFEAQTQLQFVISLIQNAQKLDSQCR